MEAPMNGEANMAANAAWIAAHKGKCECMESGKGVKAERYVGVDDTQGRFADVELGRCVACRALWLRYFVEYEAFTASGRWAMCPVKPELADSITPENAPAFLDAAPWHVFGGSYYGHAGRRGAGLLRWGI
jgi:hypothetical protein